MLTPWTSKEAVSWMSKDMAWSSPSPMYSLGSSVLPLTCWLIGGRTLWVIFKEYCCLDGFSRDAPPKIPVNCSPLFVVSVTSSPYGRC